METLQAESKAAEKAIPPLYPFWHVLKDSDKPANVKIAIRGDEANPGEEAPRAFLSILCDGEPKPFQNGSGRLELANAIASPDNPLTARVMVNRIWQYHFGEGIVRSTSNFGQLGDRPTHPELLDYLACAFRGIRWSIKAMHREMLLSSAYRMSSGISTEARVKDPDNRLFSRAPLQERMDAESLARFDSCGRGFAGSHRRWGAAASRRMTSTGGELSTRPVSRSKPDRTMAMFDFPDPNATSEQRTVTVGPLQRLYFMNSKFVAAQAKALAERVTRRKRRDDRTAYRPCLRTSLREAGHRGGDEGRIGVREDEPEPWPKYMQVLLGTAEFSAIQ